MSTVWAVQGGVVIVEDVQNAGGMRRVRAGRGWDDAFNLLVEREFAHQVRLARWIVGDPDRAREIAQESFARALARWPRVRTYDSPEAWLRTVTVRQALRVRDRANREVVGPGPDPVPAPAVDDVIVARVLIREALVHLSPQQRAVVVLHYLEDLNVRDVASALGVAEGTVKTQLSRARTRLAAVIGEHPAVSPTVTASEEVPQ